MLYNYDNDNLHEGKNENLIQSKRLAVIQISSQCKMMIFSLHRLDLRFDLLHLCL